MSMFAPDGETFGTSMYAPESPEWPTMEAPEADQPTETGGRGMRLAALFLARPKAGRNQSRHSHWFNKTIHNHYGTDHHLSANVGPLAVGLFPRKRRRQ